MITVIVVVFLTMLIVNFPGGGLESPGPSPFEMRLQSQIDLVLRIAAYNGLVPVDAMGFPIRAELDALEERLRAEAGLNLPFWTRYLLWTYKALTFNWGALDSTYLPQLGITQGLSNAPATNPVLEYLPNTLLLVGTAYLLVFLIGMPFALYLARHYGGWLDRTMSVLSPISSVPSWVFAVLLLTIFAVQLRWLPVAGMFDFHKPTEPIPYVIALLRHMILPVSALVLSLLFQLVYTWRTFFIIYSEEDYVDLARAKGLETRLLEKQYILRPALPYIITSFATSLIGFWQLTVALERVFQWPGIGLLYLEVLPNFWGERMEVGDLMVVIQIVVTFAYLLGLLVFLMDLAYVIVDPRIHLIPASQTVQSKGRVKTTSKGRMSFFARRKEKAPGLATKRSFSWGTFIRSARESLRESRESIRLFVEQLRMYPSAVFGLVVITLLLAGSIYALIALPYEQIGADYGQKRSTGRNVRPQTAAPAWLNLFRTTPQLSTLILNEDSSNASVTTEILENGWAQKTVTYRFDYRYSEIPSDVFLYLDPVYDEKFPFVSVEWTTPDGRTIHLKNKGVAGDSNYDMESAISIPRLLTENPEWKNWFVTEGQYPTPAFTLLFAKAGSTEPEPQHGTYQLKITSLFFEEASNIQSELVLLGQVYGVAGTDYWRRDLIVPLFWGMPFTLVVGFMGTLITALIAMLLPAVGVWFGGWLDSLIQRITEVNMVLPGLAIAVLAYALYGVHIWIVLGIVVVLNALGAPIKSFRSAFLQAREAPYIEMAQSYGASNFRVITRYLVPRILPVLIPHLVMQIPTFIFLEATLGFFNIQSVYPTWGRIIYEGLSEGALYGSPFWVLEPIFLLLLTGLAFAMLGLALERILNPRVIADISAAPDGAKQLKEKAEQRRSLHRQWGFNRRVVAGVVIALLAIVIFTPAIQGKTLASIFMRYLDQTWITDTKIYNTPSASTQTPQLGSGSGSTPVSSTEASPTEMPPPSTTSTTGVPTATLIASCIPGNPPASARVLEILNGNTVKVLIDGLVYVVRFIGVDVPQDDRNAFQTYLKTSELVFRKDVTLIADHVDKDANGRLLRYVLVGDTFVNLQLLQEGLGMALDTPPDVACADVFRAAERTAVESGRGMWAAPTPVPTPR